MRTKKITRLTPRIARFHLAALLPILLVTAFSSSPVSASLVFLGTATVYDDLNAETCFADCARQSFESFTTGNASIATPDSAAQSTAVLSQASSISVRSEGDTVPSGGVGAPSYTNGASGQVTLHYYFAAEGPQNITIPVLVTANGNISVTGNFASTGYSYVSEARLVIDGNGGYVANQDMFFDVGVPGLNQIATKSNSFAVDGTYNLQTNTAYEVLMQISASAFVSLGDLSNLVSIASIDPSFQIGSAYTNQYSIVFSDGISVTPSATPLPATLPLFAAGLGFVGYLARRKRKGSLAST